MYNTENDRHLHLVGIAEDERIFGFVPGGIQPEWISVLIGYRGHSLVAVGFRPFPPRVEQMQRLRENVIIDETSVNRECPHEQDNVATTTTESATNELME